MQIKPRLCDKSYAQSERLWITMVVVCATVATFEDLNVFSVFSKSEYLFEF